MRWIVVGAIIGLGGCPPPIVPMADNPLIDEGPVTEVPELNRDTCGPFSGHTLLRCVNGAATMRDVRALALPRPVGSKQHEWTRGFCEERLRSHGFAVERVAYDTGVNVIGTLPGFTRSKESVLLGAHYDHIEGCAGADDNASGVAAVLEAARVLATARYERTLVVTCFDEGEHAQRGSRAYAKSARERDDQLRLAVVLEAVGYHNATPDSQTVPKRFEEVFPDAALALIDNDFRGDFVTVVADSASRATADRFMDEFRRVGLGSHRLRLTERMKQEQGEIHRSDHVSFWDEGFTALLVTDTGKFRNPYIHCRTGQDAPDTLSPAYLAKVTQVTVAVLATELTIR